MHLDGLCCIIVSKCTVQKTLKIIKLLNMKNNSCLRRTGTHYCCFTVISESLDEQRSAFRTVLFMPGHFSFVANTYLFEILYDIVTSGLKFSRRLRKMFKDNEYAASAYKH